MKKLLIIANISHSSPRIPGIATYLSEYGWKTTIVTPPPSKNAEEELGFPKGFLNTVEIIEAPYRGDVLWPVRSILRFFGLKREHGGLTEQIKKGVGTTKKNSLIDHFLYLYQEIFGYPDTEKTWIKPALRSIQSKLERESFDSILSSSPYPASHIIAQKVSERLGIPWVADFRDLWSQNHNYTYSTLRKILDTRLEKKTIKSATAITVVSKRDVEIMEKLHQKSVFVVPNGFDPDLINKPPRPLLEKFTIRYTGKIYTNNQDISRVLRAIAKLLQNNKISNNTFALDFYGPRYEWLDAEIRSLNLQKVAVQRGVISRTEAIKKQQESHALLLLGWEDLNNPGVFTSKIFEYLAALRPIIATGGSRQEDIKKLISELHAGAVAITEEEIADTILDYYDEWNNSNTVFSPGDFKKIEAFSYHGMAKKFKDILEKEIQARGSKNN